MTCVPGCTRCIAIAMMCAQECRMRSSLSDSALVGSGMLARSAALALPFCPAGAASLPPFVSAGRSAVSGAAACGAVCLCLQCTHSMSQSTICILRSLACGGNVGKCHGEGTGCRVGAWAGVCRHAFLTHASRACVKVPNSGKSSHRIIKFVPFCVAERTPGRSGAANVPSARQRYSALLCFGVYRNSASL